MRPRNKGRIPSLIKSGFSQSDFNKFWFHHHLLEVVCQLLKVNLIKNL